MGMDTPAHPDLANWRVADAMSSPIRAVEGSMDLASAAREMVAGRIHALAVLGAAGGGEGDEPPIVGVLTDLDLVAALDGGDPLRPVVEVAGPPAHSIPAGATLATAAHDMRTLGAHHLIVVANDSGRPVGVISTLDIAQALGDAPPA